MVAIGSHSGTFCLKKKMQDDTKRLKTIQEDRGRTYGGNWFTQWYLLPQEEDAR